MLSGAGYGIGDFAYAVGANSTAMSDWSPAVSRSAQDHPSTAPRHAPWRLRSLWFFVAALAGLAVVLLQASGAASGSPPQAVSPLFYSGQGIPLQQQCDADNTPFLQFNFTFGGNFSPTDVTLHGITAVSERQTGNVIQFITVFEDPSMLIDVVNVTWNGQVGNAQLVISHGCPGMTQTTTPATTTPATTTPATTTPATTTPATTTPATTTPATTTPATTTPATSTPATSTPATSSTSPFVPGPGQTGDLPPGGGFPLRQVLIGLAVVMLGGAGTAAVQVLRRRGNHT